MEDAAEMQVSKIERIWESNKDYLRRLLIALSRDIDLADDLLQETYLRARAGISGYRGGDTRSWLSAIARNAFYAHLRRRYVHAEVPLKADSEGSEEAPGGLHDHLAVIELRRAVEGLAPMFRTALIMKHYGGFSYSEIAEHLGCPVGTAKRRVWTAMQRLRAALRQIVDEEVAIVKCSEVRGTCLLDYLYGALPDEETSKVRDHLDGCSACRKAADELGRVITGLDAFEHEHKTLVIFELDEEGVPTVYCFRSWPNDTGKPLDRLETTFSKEYPTTVLYVMVQGNTVPFDVGPHEPREDLLKYTIRPTRPIQPGDRVDFLIVFRAEHQQAAMVSSKERTWRFSSGRYIKGPSESEEVRIETLRLPARARCVSADPPADEIRTNETTTLIWRRPMAANDQFGFSVEYWI